MPFIEVEIKQNHKVGLWKITETEAELLRQFHVAPELFSLHTGRNLQVLASRLTIMKLMNLSNIEIIKASEGKPFLVDRDEHISLSHSGQFAAAVVSNKDATGIDIERMDERIFKIAHKFVREDERALLGDRDILGHYLIWNIKESLFKYYGLGSVDFRKHLYVDLTTRNDGFLKASIQKKDHHASMYFKFLLLEEEYLLTWIDHEKNIDIHAHVTP